MRKYGLYISLIFLISVFGCSDFSTGNSDYIEQPVEIKSIENGELYQPGSSVEIEYAVNETEEVLDRLVITITGPSGEVYDEITVEEEPLSGWIEPYNLDPEMEEGLYSMQFDFYSGEELFESRVLDVFVAETVKNIISINSYPPVLYPGGGGLFHAETDDVSGEAWLRWSLDGDVIAEGPVSEGYENIEIGAPETAGVYELSLEIFPFAPVTDTEYDFESQVKKEVPVYVNTEQKSGSSEFGPDEDFYSLFHFRGNFLDSVAGPDGSTYELAYSGRPVLSLRNGVFGYYMDSASGFTEDRILIPAEEGRLQPFSLMIALVPSVFESPGDQSTEIFYSGFEDGSLSLSLEVLSDGRIKADLDFMTEVYSIYSDTPLLAANEYSTIALSVQPSDDSIGLVLFENGAPVSTSVHNSEETGEFPWNNMDTEGKTGETRILAENNTGFEAMIDEFGIYNKRSPEGTSVDPEQFKRAMEMEYGKFLMYAEGFDGGSEELPVLNPECTIEDSTMIIPPGGYAEFPPIYPGYEEVAFRIELADFGAGNAVFYADVENIEMGRIEFESDEDEPVSFSLIFSSESVDIEGTGDQDGATGFEGDFGGVIYRIENADPDNPLLIESILVIRQNISVSAKKTDISGNMGFQGLNSTEISIKS